MFLRSLARGVRLTGNRCISSAAPLARGPAEPEFNRDQEIGTEGKYVAVTCVLLSLFQSFLPTFMLQMIGCCNYIPRFCHQFCTVARGFIWQANPIEVLTAMAAMA